MAKRANNTPDGTKVKQPDKGRQQPDHIDPNALQELRIDQIKNSIKYKIHGQNNNISSINRLMNKKKFVFSIENIDLIKKSIDANPDLAQYAIINIIDRLVIPTLEAAGPGSALNKALGSDVRLRKLLGLSEAQTPSRQSLSSVGKNFAAAASSQENASQKAQRASWSDETKKSKAEVQRNPAQFIRDEFEEELAAGTLARADLKKLDSEALYQAYATWIARHPEEDLRLPTEQKAKYERDLTDAALAERAGPNLALSSWVPTSALSDDQKTARRAADALRKRQWRERQRGLSQ